MAKKQTTLKDVAAQAGVSAVAVSSVLNGSRTGTRVSEETRQRILDAARSQNYFPNSVAQGLRKQQTQRIGVLFCTVRPPIVVNAYAAAILEGIFAAGGTHGYNILVFATNWTEQRVNVASIRGQQTDGVMLVAPPMGSTIVADVLALEIPTVVLSSPSEIAEVPSVDVDNAKGAELAARHLLELGHQRIAHLRGYTGQWSSHERSVAFWQTLESEGIVEDPRYHCPEKQEVGWVEEQVERWFTLSEPPTAIFTGNDELAMEVYREVTARGVRIPEDLSIVGFDDAPFSALTSPTLTTIRHPVAQVSELGAKLLVEQIENRASEAKSHRLEPSLIVRGSTRRIK